MKRFLRFSFSVLPFLGLLFLIAYLVRSDYNWTLLYANLTLVLLGLLTLLVVFWIRAYVWRIILNKFGYQFTFSQTARSQFGSVLLKYIPGKIWVPLGKASSLSLDKRDILRISGIAFLQQLIFTFWGLILGAISFILIWPEISLKWLIYIIIGLSILTGIWVSTRSWEINMELSGPFKKLNGLQIPKLTDLLFFVFLQWLLLGFAYFLAYCSFFEGIPINIVPVQVLANNIGMITVFIPAGLGVREGITSLYFHNIGFKNDQIITLAIGSRIWFILGEVIVFLSTFLFTKEIESKR